MLSGARARDAVSQGCTDELRSMGPLVVHVRYTPESDRDSRWPARQLRAMSGLSLFWSLQIFGQCEHPLVETPPGILRKLGIVEIIPNPHVRLQSGIGDE